ncbi:PadR family transcriptional regulator [Bailinhaonella thermotolerans]|uniref:PadR family transcriptional regulator n=2 Tax=Bailinhaonella thermotolerans TaxID=1070861 RepID=A0A3A4A2A6_9ACTN|nr:PadR family transcriptional regulator [Bailinhaonella thermotolerans]
MLSLGRERSGYDLKKEADRSLRFFYWSPSYSQIYGELKRLERAGFATSRVEPAEGARDRRVYSITERGREAVARWAGEAPVEPPVLKHGVMLRAWLGHLMEPGRLREVLELHRDYAERMRREAAADAARAAETPGLTYPALVLRWSERHYAAERDLTQRMLDDLDELARHPRETPRETPRGWRGWRAPRAQEVSRGASRAARSASMPSARARSDS